MYTVDLAAENFLARHGVTGRYLRAHMNPWKNSTRFGRQRFSRLKNAKQLLGMQPTLYWGDFTTSPLYGLKEFVRRDIERKHSRNSSEALERWLELFLLSQSDVPANKVLSFGQNFQSVNSVLSSLPPAQQKAIVLAYRTNFDTFLVRDPASAIEMTALVAGGRADVIEGCDPAFLLDDAVEFPDALTSTALEEFCFFFGRSSLINVDALVEKIESKTGLKAVKLEKWLKLNKYDAHREVGEMMEKIGAARFVITDTYHLCVNALRIGTPAICLAGDDEKQMSSLSDYKKKVLFKSFEIEDFYHSKLRDLSECGEASRVISGVERVMDRSFTEAKMEQVRNKVSEFRCLASDVFVASIGGSGQKK
jgi:hypothetical protein